jgi:hypothetical protein
MKVVIGPFRITVLRDKLDYCVSLYLLVVRDWGAAP